MENVRWIETRQPLVGPIVNHTALRFRPGLTQFGNDTAIGRASARLLEDVRPDLVYAFTQVALEVLRWCRERGIPSILDNANGHIANYRRVCEDEWRRWCGPRYYGHPTPAMVRRVEREYALADRVRVHSEWAKRSLMTGGFSDEGKIVSLDQPIDLARFVPGVRTELPKDGPLRIVYVGSVDVRKGVFHLLSAMRRASSPTKLLVVGSTGNRPTRKALAREAKGLDVTLAPGDPLPAYLASDVFVMPTLEDAFGLAVAEAMACGLPVIATDQCGASEWVESSGGGWVVPAGNQEALTSSLEDAFASRNTLATIGARNRTYVEGRAGDRCFVAVRETANRLLQLS
jgi:glycosyltransferase involved in cell wall biosynthesis